MEKSLVFSRRERAGFDLKIYWKTLSFLRHSISANAQKLITAQINGAVYVVMKPVVEGMGLAWQTQHRKILEDPRYHHMVIPFYRPENTGQNFNFVCLPVDQLNGWLKSINANKVRPEIREKVLSCQKQGPAIFGLEPDAPVI